MNLEKQNRENLINFYKEELLRIHNEEVSYGTIFDKKTERSRLKKHGIVYRPTDKPMWYVELTPYTKEVLMLEN